MSFRIGAEIRKPHTFTQHLRQQSSRGFTCIRKEKLQHHACQDLCRSSFVHRNFKWTEHNCTIHHHHHHHSCTIHYHHHSCTIHHHHHSCTIHYHHHSCTIHHHHHNYTIYYHHHHHHHHSCTIHYDYHSCTIHHHHSCTIHYHHHNCTIHHHHHSCTIHHHHHSCTIHYHHHSCTIHHHHHSCTIHYHHHSFIHCDLLSRVQHSQPDFSPFSRDDTFPSFLLLKFHSEVYVNKLKSLKVEKMYADFK
ncbi:uncharacterized protein ACNS7B_012982 [Menidia menidia]